MTGLGNGFAINHVVDAHTGAYTFIQFNNGDKITTLNNCLQQKQPPFEANFLPGRKFPQLVLAFTIRNCYNHHRSSSTAGSSVGGRRQIGCRCGFFPDNVYFPDESRRGLREVINDLFLMAGCIGWGNACDLGVYPFLALWITESRFFTQGGNDECS